jgi:hypothetical protein
LYGKKQGRFIGPCRNSRKQHHHATTPWRLFRDLLRPKE